MGRIDVIISSFYAWMHAMWPYPMNNSVIVKYIRLLIYSYIDMLLSLRLIKDNWYVHVHKYEAAVNQF